MTASQLREQLAKGVYRDTFARLYCADEAGVCKQVGRYTAASLAFDALFGTQRTVSLFSAPGRTEIGGNHTDHQRGRVLAAAVNLDVIAVVARNEDQIIRIKSEGYEMDIVDLVSLAPDKGERNLASALIRGIAARFVQLGRKIGGFDAYTTSNVLSGSGLSSSAAFEVLVGTVLNHLFNEAAFSPAEIAQIGQYAENVYFGKPCGLMDQTASAVGGFVAIDFADPAAPKIDKLAYDFASSGHVLCIVNTGGNHADLTPDYAAVPAEMREVAALFGKTYLREVDEAAFFAAIPSLRGKTSDRAILRAIHFFGDNARVVQQSAALSSGDFAAFKTLVLESGRSSYQYLQNVFSSRCPSEQGVSLALALSERVLKAGGAWRVHGGGFAGTIQAYVPTGLLDEYRCEIERVMGKGTCYVLSVRPEGGICVLP